jgi:hypothetical protein
VTDTLPPPNDSEIPDGSTDTIPAPPPIVELGTEELESDGGGLVTAEDYRSIGRDRPLPPLTDVGKQP